MLGNEEIHRDEEKTDKYPRSFRLLGGIVVRAMIVCHLILLVLFR